MFHILKTNYLLILLIVLYTSTNKVFGNVYCITIKSIKSQTFDDARTYSTCPSYAPTMVSCGGKTADSTSYRFDGTYIDSTIIPTRCYANNAGALSDESGSGGVYAYARCCNFKPSDIDCEYFSTSKYSSNSDDAIISAHCGTTLYNTMLGCTVHTPWAYLDGAYPGYSSVAPNTRQYFDTHNYPHYNQCTAQNGAHGGGVKANLACCKSPTYTLTCITRYGSPTHPISSVTCPSGYFMSGCSGWSLYRPNGWWIEKSSNVDYCKARSAGTYNAYSVATCCRLQTDSPTTDPTPSPTPAPTPSPTAYPTINPTINPTVTPSNMPSNMPSINPNISPNIETTVSAGNPTDNMSEQEHMSTENTGSDIRYIHVKTDGDNSSGVIGGLIGALLICVCCIGGLVIWYFWKKRKNMDDGMKDIGNVNRGSPNIMSSISAQSCQMEGGNGTLFTNKVMSTNYKGYDTLEQKDNMLMPSLPDEKNEKVNLLVDENSSEDNDMYNMINQNEKEHNDTRMLSLDEDEDVLPR